MKKPTIELPRIRIWDNLLDDRFLLDLDEESNYYTWVLNNTANRFSFPYGKKSSHLFWVSDLFSKEDPHKPVPTPILDLFEYLIKNVLKKPFHLQQIQINGQSMGQDGTCHMDSQLNSKEYTLMVFINYKWEKEWGGEFQTLKDYDNSSKITNHIEYIPGRIILFDGSIPHRGLSPNIPYVVRKSLVFRLKDI